jgi:hypothetical protein
MDVLPTRAIRMFTNSLGKRTLPNTKILFRVIYYGFNIKEFFTVLQWRCSNPIQDDKAFQQKSLYAPEVVFTRPKDFLEGWMSCQQGQ